MNACCFLNGAGSEIPGVEVAAAGGEVDFGHLFLGLCFCLGGGGGCGGWRGEGGGGEGG